MTQRSSLWLGLAVLVAGTALVPDVHWPLFGWARGEAFYRNRPTSYWEAEFLRIPVLRGVGCGERCMPFLDIGAPVVDFDADATPVLLELLSSRHEQARLLAMKNLPADARAAIPELQRLALTTESYWEYCYAEEALNRIDPTAVVPERDPSKLSWWW